MDTNLPPETVSRYWDIVDKHLVRYGKTFRPAMITRTAGSYMYDETGRAILDFGSGQMCATVGHNHPAVVAAIRQACDEPMHLYSVILSPAVVELAEELAALLPPALQKSLFLSTGAESNEAAIRMAKLKTGGFEVLSLGTAWHGMTAGAQSSTFHRSRKGYGPVMPGVMSLPAPNGYRCPIRHCAGECDRTCLEVGFEMADAQSVKAPAAVMCEPVLAAGGVVVPPPGYLARLRELCRERGMLLIFDEAQTGLGRTGTMFRFEADGVVPDILTLSKTLGGGVAMAATVTSAEIEEELAERGFYFYTSHVSDPLPARAAQAIIRLLVGGNLADRAREMGDYLMAGLRDLQQRHECVGDLRGAGLMIGVELVRNRHTRTPWPELGARAVTRAFELGLQTTLSGPMGTQSGTVIKLVPPLTITREEADSALAILDQVLAEGTG